MEKLAPFVLILIDHHYHCRGCCGKRWDVAQLLHEQRKPTSPASTSSCSVLDQVMIAPIQLQCIFSLYQKDLGPFPYQSAHRKSMSWVCAIMAHILTIQYHVMFSWIEHFISNPEHSGWARFPIQVNGGGVGGRVSFDHKLDGGSYFAGGLISG